MFGGLFASLAACTPTPVATPLTRQQIAALRIARFEVDTAATVFDNAGARSVRNTLPAELQSVLRSEFRDRVPDRGWTMRVEVSFLGVSTSTNTALGRDQSRLTGTVSLRDEAGALRANFPVTVTAGEEAESVGGSLVTALVRHQGRYYRALLIEFARETCKLTLGPDLPSERLIRRATN